MADFSDLIKQMQQMTGDPNVDKLVAAGKDPNLAQNKAGRYYRSRDYELARLMDMLQGQGSQIMQNIQGVHPDVSQEDIDLIQKLQQATLAPGLAQISGNAGARGLTGSSIEGVQRGQFAAQTALGSQQQLQGLAFQRAGFELNRQQQLFNTLVQSVMPQIDTIEMSKQRGQQTKMQNKWWQNALQSIPGAAAGFATGGPAGAAVGAASSFVNTSGSPYDPNTPLPWGMP